jgi:hypothetical protein
VAEQALAAGSYGLSLSPFYSYGNPLVRIELLRDGLEGSELLAKTEQRFDDAAPKRVNLALDVGKAVQAGETLRLSVTTLEAGDPRYFLRLVLNAGSGDRSSSIACPLPKTE